MEEKIKNIEEIEELVKLLKEEGKQIVTTNGSFDILHSAHVRLFSRAKKEGDHLIVLLNSDDSIRRNKGENRPIIPQDERAHMISSLSAVDHVVIFEEDKPLDYLKIIGPDKHVKGGSWDPERMREEKEFVESWRGEYLCFDLEEGFSTTNIINKILQANS